MKVYSADWVLPVDGAPIERGGVAVEHGRIVAVGRASDLGDDGEHFAGAVILPGLVNAHSHLEGTGYAGFGDGLPFRQWLDQQIERSRRLEWQQRLDVARLGAAECLASGITTIGDASHSGAAGIAAFDLGLRATVYLEVFGAGTEHIAERFEANRARIAHVVSDRVRLGISPHSPYTASTALYRAAAELGLPIATHFAETRAERDWLVDGSGPWAGDAFLLPPTGETGIRALAREGLLSDRVIAAHCVDLDAEEIALLAEHDVAVAHCPRSNATLGCGIAPVADLLAAGVRVGLGTDSPASAPSFDMFEEMRLGLWLGRAREQRADAVTPAQALRLATLGAAEALGLAAEIGSLSPGKHADLCILELAGSPFDPIEDPAVAAVLGGAPERVCRTIVGGMTRYARGETEWRELRRSAAGVRERMLGQPISR